MQRQNAATTLYISENPNIRSGQQNHLHVSVTHLYRGGVFFPEFQQLLVPLFDFLIDGLIFDLQLLEVDKVQPADSVESGSEKRCRCNATFLMWFG